MKKERKERKQQKSLLKKGDFENVQFKTLVLHRLLKEKRRIAFSTAISF